MQAGWDKGTTKEQWGLPALETAAPPGLTLKVGNPVPPYMSLAFFELLRLYWSLAQVFVNE